MEAIAANGDLFVRAYELAYFIHQDKRTALDIASEATSKLEVACAVQDKRLYYSPTGRASARRSRSKVSLSEPHLLQRLVYIGSEAYEQEKERSNLVDEEDMTIHYIKHLVKTTIKRNSFYVTLGLSRLLHSYSTQETANIYNVVVQDPDRVRDDYYYRSRKGRLMKEMKDRFGDFINVIRGHRGEEKFQADEEARQQRGLIRECLEWFTPWKSPCVVPSGFDPLAEVIPTLAFDGDDPDQEHSIETSRIHSVMHPDCFLRLTSSLKLESPEEKLALPHFFLSSREGRPPRSRHNPPPLDKDDIASVGRRLDEQSARRRKVSAALMSIAVDGSERARFDPAAQKSVHFRVEEGDELIEIRSFQKEGDLLLASMVMNFDDLDDESARRVSIVLEGRQKLSLAFSPERDGYGEISGAVVEAEYHETGFARAVSLAVRRRLFALSESVSAPVWKPALALLLLALVAGGVYLLIQRGGQEQPIAEKENQIQEQQQPPEPQQAVVQPNEDQLQPKESPRQHQPNRKPKSDRVTSPGATIAEKLGSNPPVEDDPSDAVIATRSTARRIPGAALSEVKRVYVQAIGNDAFSRQARETIEGAIESSERLALAASIDDADAVLKVNAAMDAAGGNAVIFARLVNAPGYVIWPARARRSGAKFTGSVEGAAASIVGALVGEIEKAERRR